MATSHVTGHAALRSLALKTRPVTGVSQDLVAFVVDAVTGLLRMPREGDADDLPRVTFELRAPTVGEQANLVKAARKVTKRAGPKGEETLEVDVGRLQLLALIACAFEPLVGADGAPTFGGTVRVFTSEDLPVLEESVLGSHVDVLARRCLGYVNLSGEEVGKG